MKFQFIFHGHLKIITGLLLIAGLRLTCGKVETWHTCDETLPTFFVKKKWTWQFSFEHPYASDHSDWVHAQHAGPDGRWLPHTDEARAFAAYCRARYGLVIAGDPAAEDRCRAFRIGD